MFKV